MTVTATIHTPPPDPEPDRRVVTLTMPYDVAVTLRSLIGWNIGGTQAGTYRTHTDKIYEVLDTAGVARDGTNARFAGHIDALPFTK